MRTKSKRKKTKRIKKSTKKVARKIRPLSELGVIVRVRGGGGYLLHS